MASEDRMVQATDGKLILGNLRMSALASCSAFTYIKVFRIDWARRAAEAKGMFVALFIALLAVLGAIALWVRGGRERAKRRADQLARRKEVQEAWDRMMREREQARRP